MNDSLSDVMWWSRLWRLARRVFSSASRLRATCRSDGQASWKTQCVLTERNRKPRRLYFLIYRLPKHWFPDANYTTPIGGLVVPVEEGGLVESVACQRYHIAPYE